MQCAHVLVALFELFQGMCGPPHEHDLAARERAQWEGSDPPMTSILYWDIIYKRRKEDVTLLNTFLFEI